MRPFGKGFGDSLFPPSPLASAAATGCLAVISAKSASLKTSKEESPLSEMTTGYQKRSPFRCPSDTIDLQGSGITEREKPTWRLWIGRPF